MPLTKITRLNEKPEIVTSTIRCQEITSSVLDDSQPIGVDIEGVRLGVKGPLTLLQLVTLSDKRYIFDVQENKELICEGKLKDVLENESIIKVIHGCFNDSAALYHQFGVKLHNVFDTCIAESVLEEANGVRFPVFIKLADLINKYGGTLTATKTWDQWKYTPDIWAQRPLTELMIDYAIGDVSMMFPYVYNQQKKKIEDMKLMDKFEERVDENIHEYIEPDRVTEQRHTRKLEMMKDELADIEKKHKDSVISDLVVKALSDSSAIALWETLRENIEDLGKTCIELRERMFQMCLNQNEAGIKRNSRDFVNKQYDRRTEGRINLLKDKGTGYIKVRATQFLDLVDKERIKKALWKYNKSYTLGTAEKFLLFRINEDKFPIQESRKIKAARASIATELEREVKRKPVDDLNGAQKGLLRCIPDPYFTDSTVKAVKANLPAEEPAMIHPQMFI